MKIIFFIFFLFILNCSLNKVENHHGVYFLDEKYTKLEVKSSNKNDILNLLGPPSTKSSFDNDIWIYVERKTTTSSLFKLGKEKLTINNVLILEINNRGLLTKKDFLDINDMEKLNFSTKETDVLYSKKSFVYDFLSSIRQKVNDPKNRRKKIN